MNDETSQNLQMDLWHLLTQNLSLGISLLFGLKLGGFMVLNANVDLTDLRRLDILLVGDYKARFKHPRLNLYTSDEQRVRRIRKQNLVTANIGYSECKMLIFVQAKYIMIRSFEQAYKHFKLNMSMLFKLFILTNPTNQDQD